MVEKLSSKPALAFFNASNFGSGAESLVAATVTALAKKGHNVSLNVRKVRAHSGQERQPWVSEIRYLPGEKFAERAARFLTGYNDYFFQTIRHLGAGNDGTFNADILHFHNLHGHYISIPELSQLSHNRKIVISPVDEFLGTGYCTYNMGCERLALGCGSCPQLNSPYPKISRDSTAALYKVKHRAVIESNFNLLVHTKYLAQFYRQQFGEHCQIDQIYYGVNTEIFRPRNRLDCSMSLGLPLSKKFVVGIMHSNITEPRKGMIALLEKLREAAGNTNNGMELLVVGAESESAKKFQTDKLVVTTLPYLPSELALSYALNLCDVLLYPTKADNLSLTTLSAISCGIPVISSSIGGQSEAIDDGKEGFLCNFGDLDQFVSRTLQLKNNCLLLTALSAQARRRALEQFDFDNYVSSLQDYYVKIESRVSNDA